MNDSMFRQQQEGHSGGKSPFTPVTVQPGVVSLHPSKSAVLGTKQNSETKQLGVKKIVNSALLTLNTEFLTKAQLNSVSRCNNVICLTFPQNGQSSLYLQDSSQGSDLRCIELFKVNSSAAIKDSWLCHSIALCSLTPADNLALRVWFRHKSLIN